MQVTDNDDDVVVIVGCFNFFNGFFFQNAKKSKPKFKVKDCILE